MEMLEDAKRLSVVTAAIFSLFFSSVDLISRLFLLPSLRLLAVLSILPLLQADL